MAKRGEIREGIDTVLNRPIGISAKEIGDRQHAIYIDSNSRDELRQELLKELASQGCVIKVKCPHCSWSQFTNEVVGMTPCFSCNSTGYIFEPLIKEG